MMQICGKWLKYVGEMTYLFDKLLKNFKNDFEIWDMAKIIG